MTLHPASTQTNKDKAIAKHNALVAALTTALNALGHKTTPPGHLSGVLRVDVAGCPAVWVRFMFDTGSASSFSTRFTGKLKMTIEAGLERQYYPEPKAGYDVDKTIERIIHHAQVAKQADDARLARVNAETAAYNFKCALEDKLRYEVCPSKGVESLPVTLDSSHARERAKLTATVTAAEAEAIVKLLIDMRKAP
jgi:hypothetical protein